ncbi:MAG: CRISPR/Cas system-associated protein Cas5 (RAMP superfamily) [Gammaproteobacteria bacterium]|jgi:CRISPR/Cas system-associated protein Cas5 (RAMP superfamily)
MIVPVSDTALPGSAVATGLHLPPISTVIGPLSSSQVLDTRDTKI